jgi:hypothetical protein
MKETLKEASKRALKSGLFKDETLFIAGAKWQQEQLCNSEIIQRIKATKSDAEARRIIKSI